MYSQCFVSLKPNLWYLLSLIFIITFVFCITIAVVAVLISHQFIATYNSPFHRNYFYYLVAFYAFAFYSIWGQIMMRTVLASIISQGDLVVLVANFLPVLGIPFLYISWLMLIKSGYSLVNMKSPQSVTWIHIGLLLAVFGLIWILLVLVDPLYLITADNVTYSEIGLVLLFDFIYISWFASIVFLRSNTLGFSTKTIVNRFAMLICFGFLIRGLVLPFFPIGGWVLAPLILLYFLSNLPALLYLKIKNDILFTPVHADHPSDNKLEEIFKRYKISKREREIVLHICQGKTNKEIADELFISLQTVKDHTHRIYSKIGINSRMKLVQLVNT